MQLSKMIPEVDTHTHTIISGHAWSTLTENCLAAKALGMKGLCLTEHGPAIEGGAPAYIPHSQHMLPETVEEIRVYGGVEANILGYDGGLDIPEKYLKLCDFAIASIHGEVFPVDPDPDANTELYRKILRDPWIDMIGHPEDARVPCDFEALTEEAGRQGKLLEVNNLSATNHRPGSVTTVRQLLLCCKARGQRICVSSDAHFRTMVGDVSAVMPLLEEVDFPQELIVNLTKERFDNYLKERNHRLAQIHD